MKKHWMLICVIIFILFFSPTAVNADFPVEVSFLLPEENPGIGETAEIELYINDVEALYAFDIRFVFDPQIIRVNYLQAGDFLDPGFIILNSIDQDQVAFAVTQLNPSQPKTGSGVLVKINFTVLQEGFCPLEFTRSELSNGDGELITHDTVDTEMTISAEAATATTTPTPTSTAPAPSTTFTPTPTSTTPSGVTTQPTNTKTPTPTGQPGHSPTATLPASNPQPTKTLNSYPAPAGNSVSPTPVLDAEDDYPPPAAMVTEENSDSTTPLVATATEAVMGNASDEEISIPVSGEVEQPETKAEPKPEWEQSAAFQIMWWTAITFFSGLTLIFIYGIWMNDRKKRSQK